MDVLCIQNYEMMLGSFKVLPGNRLAIPHYVTEDLSPEGCKALASYLLAALGTIKPKTGDRVQASDARHRFTVFCYKNNHYAFTYETMMPMVHPNITICDSDSE